MGARIMSYKMIAIQPHKKIALVAHDNKKDDLLKWAKFNLNSLREHEISATGTTGAMLEKELDIPINKLRSGPLGGCANRRKDYRAEHRFSGLLLGSFGTSTARPGHQGTAAHRCGLEYPGGMQLGFGGLHVFLTPDDRGIPAPVTRLR